MNGLAAGMDAGIGPTGTNDSYWSIIKQLGQDVFQDALNGPLGLFVLGEGLQLKATKATSIVGDSTAIATTNYFVVVGRRRRRRQGTGKHRNSEEEC
jgi:hypothetical protein